MRSSPALSARCKASLYSCLTVSIFLRTFAFSKSRRIPVSSFAMISDLHASRESSVGRVTLLPSSPTVTLGLPMSSMYSYSLLDFAIWSGVRGFPSSGSAIRRTSASGSDTLSLAMATASTILSACIRASFCPCTVFAPSKALLNAGAVRKIGEYFPNLAASPRLSITRATFFALSPLKNEMPLSENGMLNRR